MQNALRGNLQQPRMRIQQLLQLHRNSILQRVLVANASLYDEESRKVNDGVYRKLPLMLLLT